VPERVSDDRQRIDKWLWHARIVRTRSAAAALAASGHVRLNGARVAAASKPVKPGDVVTIALDARVRVLKVTGFALRRGAAEQGRALYEDMTPAEPAPAARSEEAPSPQRNPGSGRPTKRERRAIERFTRDFDE
jgi:ribosome-associated heat shock protein Hsp15